MLKCNIPIYLRKKRVSLLISQQEEGDLPVKNEHQHQKGRDAKIVGLNQRLRGDLESEKVIFLERCLVHASFYRWNKKTSLGCTISSRKLAKNTVGFDVQN